MGAGVVDGVSVKDVQRTFLRTNSNRGRVKAKMVQMGREGSWSLPSPGLPLSPEDFDHTCLAQEKLHQVTLA